MRLSFLTLSGVSLFVLFLTQPIKGSNAVANLGSVSVGSSGNGTVTIPFASAPSAVPNISLHYGTDFSITGTCSANSSSCSLPIKFSPGKAGLRQDAVIVKDGSSGAVLAEAFLYGTGSGPEMTFNPATAHIVYTGVGGEFLEDITSDASGNLYITTGLHTIERIAAGGSTPVIIAGQPNTFGSSGDGGPATSATLSSPDQVTIDSAGNIYFVDGGTSSENQVIRRVDAATGIITTVAGIYGASPDTPEPLDGSLATSGNFGGFAAIAVDLRGDLYLGVSTNIFDGPLVIRKIDATTDIISTIAGGASSVHSGDGGLATAAGFGGMNGLVFDGSGNIYVSEGSWIRKIDATTQIISSIAGNGTYGFAGIGGPAVSAEISAQLLRIDPFGNLYVNNTALDDGASTSTIEIQKIDHTTGILSNFAGLVNGARPAEGLLSSVVDFEFFSPHFTFDSNGNYYVLTLWPFIVQFNTITPSYNFLTAGTSSYFPSPLTVAVTNVGDQSLSIASASVAGSFQLEQATAQGCTFPDLFATGASCLLTINPALNSGNLNGSLALNSSPASSNQTVGLSFTYPNISLSPAALDFGVQQLGLSTNLGITLKDATTAPYVFDHISIQGPNAGDFAASFSCPDAGAFAWCNVYAVFTPTSSGTRSATLLIYGNTQSPLSVPLSGVGSVPTLILSSSALVFAQTQWGTSSSQTVTVTNNGQVPIVISPANSAVAGPFTMANSCVSANPFVYPQPALLPGQSCNIAVSFQPGGLVGTFSGSYTLSTSIPGPQPVVSFVGTSSITGPALTFGALPVAFQAPRNETSAPVPMALTNTGNLVTVIDSITLSGAQASDFHQFNNCPSSLSPGQGCLIWISYAPGAASAQSATTSVALVANGSSLQSQQISGTIMDSSAARVFIESPGAFASVKGMLTISGWVSQDGQTLYGVNLYVDNATVGFGSANMRRPDVCSAYPSTGNCPSPGWSYQFDTTGFPDGVHTLTAVAIGNTVQTGVSTTFTIANGSAKTVPTIEIDAPAKGQSFSGTAIFSGWSLDSQGTANNSVSALIDGAASITTEVNARPDVCKALNKAPQICSANGWYSSVDTRHLSNGNHTLTVIANDHSTLAYRVNFTTVSFAVQNVTNPVLINLEAPAPNQTVTIIDNINLSGWAISTTAPIATIDAQISGYPSSLAGVYYGYTRLDVCAAYPTQASCALGFAGLFSTISVPNGPHTLELIAYLTDGTTFTAASIPVIIANISGANDQFLINVETPASNGILSGTAKVSGWVADGLTSYPQLNFAVDDVPVGVTVPSFARPDVCNAYPWAQGCPNVGWTTAVDTTLLTDGPHTLTVTATASTGKRITKTIPFTANNSSAHSADGQITSIESPAAGSTISGALGVSGWAVSAASPIQEIDILVDGAPVGTAQYGFARPDVCKAYPQSQSCPGVGWYFLLDTRTLSDGPHAIEAIQVTSSGNFSTAQKFTVFNGGVAPTIQASIDAPAAGATLNGSYQVSGWALDNNDSILNVAVNIDGLPQGFATYGATRSDVCTLFPGRAGCPNVGWYFIIDTSQFQNGAHTIDVVISSTHGHVVTVTRPIQISN